MEINICKYYSNAYQMYSWKAQHDKKKEKQKKEGERETYFTQFVFSFQVIFILKYIKLIFSGVFFNNFIILKTEIKIKNII
jgi:hypothetical protein